MNTNEKDPLKLLASLETYGYEERECTIGGVKIKLAPLTVKEAITVFEISSQYNDIDASIQALKVETLVRSIVAINDIRFDPSVVSDQKKDVITKFSNDVIDLLFGQYCELDKYIKVSLDKFEESLNNK